MSTLMAIDIKHKTEERKEIEEKRDKIMVVGKLKSCRKFLAF